jgi:hypothetical protein
MMQNKAARVITKTKKKDHITPVLKALHWLPVVKRIDYKIACQAFNCIHGSAPHYLKCLVDIQTSNRQLRSSNSTSLERKIPRNKFAERSFTHSAPVVWNSLTARTRNCQTLETFKKHLKQISSVLHSISFHYYS